MKVSLIIAILDSHEIVRRYLLYLEKLDLASDIEVIFVDDGSDPSINCNTSLQNFKLLATHDTRRWTQGLARMKGIAESNGEYILCTDIDHVISKEAFEFSRTFDGDKAIFQRRFAFLDADGRLVRDRERVIEWGLLPKAIRDENLSSGVHGNTWLMRRSVFDMLGGYDIKRCNSGTHLQGEDREFNGKWSKAVRKGKVRPQQSGPPIYFFPMGKYHITGDDNPHGLFHNLEHTKWGKT